MATAMDIDSDWVLETVLGSGGFGIVELWRNTHTGNKIAIKKCKSGDAQLTERQRERWVDEVDKMNQLKHQNIVGTRPLPDELKNGVGSLPVLCMEYCSKGDLRFVLSKSENWAGLAEPDAMQIFRDVASAISYLHFQKITHRDLKPENVVLQEWNNKIIYKLIDLGYAKELGHDSICASAVGTLNYVAPEILWAEKYTCSVDYWSLGILFYEVITGSRPFLPNETSPIEWKKHISRKSNDDICVQYENGDVVYKQDIQDTTDISPCIRNGLKDWFRTVLQWDPKKRGRQCQKNGTEVMVVFSMLAQILSKKVIHVFCVPHYRIFHYEISSATTLKQLRCFIEQDTQINISSQELLDPDGSLLKDDGIIKLSTLQGKLLTLSKKESVLTEIPDPDVPCLVRKIIETPKMTMTKYELQRCYSAAIFFVKKEAQLFRSYILALCMKIDLVNSKFDTILSKKDQMASGFNLLQAEFHSMCELVQNDVTNGLDTLKNEIKNLTQKLEFLSERVRALKAKCDKFLHVRNILIKLGDIEWTAEYRELLEKAQDIVENSKTLSEKSKHQPVRMAKFIFELLKCRKNLMNNKQLVDMKSEIDHVSTAQAAKDFSKQEKYVESAVALIDVYREQISNLRKKWENYKQVASFPENLDSMDVECNADDNRELESSVRSLNEGDGLTSDHVIYDNLVIRYLMHDFISETYEQFKQIMNLNP
ncbi:inhibitor of nuclear factor kappa-B kinase subunit beta [Diprion similis]|uniref:inhibitor of nuclear factor kappa-B kinase subunit beta n=1 Tax=Diprion similis TaxID=362088 RepID=UPI001EF85323|nr:inhibitor of nuclear factor kappa-B kinase subunit beta [Diprion similis]